MAALKPAFVFLLLAATAPAPSRMPAGPRGRGTRPPPPAPGRGEAVSCPSKRLRKYARLTEAQTVVAISMPTSHASQAADIGGPSCVVNAGDATPHRD